MTGKPRDVPASQPTTTVDGTSITSDLAGKAPTVLRQLVRPLRAIRHGGRR